MNLIWILDALVITGYFLGEAMTEGFTWANPKRRLENRFIRLSFKVKEAKGKFGYHQCRLPETVFGFYGCERFFGFWNGIGAFLILLFMYERVLNKIVSDKWFKPNTATYSIWKWTVPRKQWHDWAALILGLIILYL